MKNQKFSITKKMPMQAVPFDAVFLKHAKVPKVTINALFFQTTNATKSFSGKVYLNVVSTSIICLQKL